MVDDGNKDNNLFKNISNDELIENGLIQGLYIAKITINPKTGKKEYDRRDAAGWNKVKANLLKGKSFAEDEYANIVLKQSETNNKEIVFVCIDVDNREDSNKLIESYKDSNYQYFTTGTKSFSDKLHLYLIVENYKLLKDIVFNNKFTKADGKTGDSFEIFNTNTNKQIIECSLSNSDKLLFDNLKPEPIGKVKFEEMLIELGIEYSYNKLEVIKEDFKATNTKLTGNRDLREILGLKPDKYNRVSCPFHPESHPSCLISDNGELLTDLHDGESYTCNKEGSAVLRVGTDEVVKELTTKTSEKTATEDDSKNNYETDGYSIKDNKIVYEAQNKRVNNGYYIEWLDITAMEAENQRLKDQYGEELIDESTGLFREDSPLLVKLWKQNISFRKELVEFNEVVGESKRSKAEDIEKNLISEDEAYTYPVGAFPELPEVNAEELPEKEPDKTFQDYDKQIQDQAIKQLKEGKFLDNLIYTVNQTHEGDQRQIKYNYLTYGTLFLNNPVHRYTDGDTGAGKSDLDNESLKNLPPQFIKRYRTVSSKNIYYDKDNFNNKYNIIVFDDYVDKEANEEIVKELSDNTKEVKELRTVNKIKNENKAQTLTLKGQYQTILNSAKPLKDNELLNRFFMESISTDAEHQSKVKYKILNNMISNKQENHHLKILNEINQATYIKLLEEDNIIFNPYLDYLNVNNINNRNIPAYIGFIKVNTFYNQYQRYNITFNDEKIVLGSINDYIDIVENIPEQAIKQNLKLSSRQERILELLPILTDEEIEDIRSEASENLEHAKTLDNVMTYQKLSPILNVNATTINKDIKGRKEGTQSGLTELGLVSIHEFDMGSNRRDVFISKNSENITRIVKNNKNTNDILTIQKAVQKHPQITINKLIHTFLTTAKILNIYREQHNIENFIEEYLTKNPVDINELDNWIYELLQKFVDDYGDELLENNGNVYDIDEIMKNQDYEKSVNDNFFTCFLGFVNTMRKSTEKSLFDEQNDVSHRQTKKQYVSRENISNEDHIDITENNSSEDVGNPEDFNQEYTNLLKIDECEKLLFETINNDKETCFSIPSQKNLINYVVKVKNIDKANKSEFMSAFNNLIEKDKFKISNFDFEIL